MGDCTGHWARASHVSGLEGALGIFAHTFIKLKVHMYSVLLKKTISQYFEMTS